MSKKKNNYEGVIISVSFFVVIITIGAFHFNDSFDLSTHLATDKLGHFGDFIGGFLGTILTIIATIYVYKTFHSQKKELRSQKKELKLQRQLVAQQQFESTFFNMLNVHRELKNNFKYSRPNFGRGLEPTEKFGLDVIKMIRERYWRIYTDVNNTYNGEPNMYSKSHEIEQNLIKFKKDDLKLELSKIIISYKVLFHQYQNFLSHYCRNVFHILKFIRENEKNETLGNDKMKYKNYANIFQSQLNVDEQFILFYNFIHFNKETENEIFWTINLVNHFKFLENIGIGNLLIKKHELFYDFEIKGSDRVI